MIYRIWAQVTGGRTGTREAWLKEKDTIMMWTDKAEAESHADVLNTVMNRPNSTTRFTHTVKET